MPGVVVEISEAGSQTRLRQGERYSWRLVLTTTGSVFGVVVPGIAGAGQTATLVVATLVALFSAVFTGEGPATRSKALAALVLTLVAVILTFSGFTLADHFHGKSVVADRPYTLPVPAPLLVERQAVSTPKPSTTSTSSSNSDPNTSQNPDPPSPRDLNPPRIPASFPSSHADPNPPGPPVPIPPGPPVPIPPGSTPEKTQAPWVARHGMTSAQYQQTFNELVGQGFRLVQVSGYEVGGTDRYAAIFEKRAGG